LPTRSPKRLLEPRDELLAGVNVGVLDGVVVVLMLPTVPAPRRPSSWGAWIN